MKYKLNQILTKYSEKNTNNYEPVAVGRYGIRKRSDIYKKELSNDYLKNKVIFQNVLIIGMGSVQIDVGVLKENLYYSVSPAYHTFKINTSIVLSEYLELLFLAKNSYYTKLYMIASARQGKKVDVEGLLNEIVEIPNLIKQQEIIDKINKINKLTRNYENQLQLLDEIIKSRFVEMFEDEQKKLKLEKIAKIGSSHRVFVDEFVEFGVPFYRGTEIGLLSQGITDFKPYYISKSRYDELASDYTKPEIGDILMPSICDKGQLWIVNTVEPFYYKDGRVLSIRPDKEVIIPGFLHYFLKIKLTEIYKEIATGATFAEFKIFLLKDINVVLPSINRQKQFADFAKQVDKLKFIVEEQLKLMNELLNKKMDEYFS